MRSKNVIHVKANLHAAICRPRQIGARIGACEWRSDVRATPIRQETL